jgi:uncharacterized membrane protein YkoI
MHKSTLSLSMLVALIATSFTALAAKPPAAPQHGVTMAQAQAIALKAAPGKIKKQEREEEDGAMRYSFDIRQGDRIHEIGVDVATGRIVEDKFESASERD